MESLWEQTWEKPSFPALDKDRDTEVLIIGGGMAGHTAVTDQGRIRAGKIIVATHFPFINKHGGYFLKLYQQRSYVIALKNAPDVKGMYLDEAKTGLSFRNYKDLLLIGGGGHRTGKPGGGWQELEAFARQHYPGAREVATGFNKWGMTTSSPGWYSTASSPQTKTRPGAAFMGEERIFSGWLSRAGMRWRSRSR